MSRLFKPSITRYVDADGRRVSSSTPGARKRKLKSKTWRGEYRDHAGIRRTASLCANKEAARVMLSDIERRENDIRAGKIDPQREPHLKRTLDEHVDDFERFLESKGNSEKHVAVTIARVRAALTGCGFDTLRTLDAARLSSWLADKRSAGMSIASANYYLQSVKSFASFCVRSRRLAENPFAHLSGGNAKTDRRRVRRTLTAADLNRLLTVTRASTSTFRGLDGRTRALLYAFAARTGLREGEIASLTERSLRLDDDPATVVIDASDEKARRGAELPLHPDVASELRQWLQDRRQAADDSPGVLRLTDASDAVLWSGSWWRVGAKMLRRDLEAAGIPDVDDSGHVFDFHSLRSQFITDLSRAGVSLQDAQKLARHSDPRLTANSYTRPAVSDLAHSVSRLPSLPVQPQALRATGTDPKMVAEMVAALVAVPIDISCKPSMTVDGSAVESFASKEAKKPLQTQGFHGVSMGESEEAPPGFEPGVVDLQSTANPLNSSVSEDGCRNGCRPNPEIASPDASPADPDLARVVASWDTLPTAIRTAVLTLIDAASPRT